MASFVRDWSGRAGRMVMQTLTWPGGHEMVAVETDTLSPLSMSILIHAVIYILQATGTSRVFSSYCNTS